MLKNEAENIDRISHNIESLSKDMYEIKKTVFHLFPAGITI